MAKGAAGPPRAIEGCARIPAHRKPRRRNVNQPLRILRTGRPNPLYALLLRASPLRLGRGPRLFIENILRRRGRKFEPPLWP
jgi:hypothetical protein